MNWTILLIGLIIGWLIGMLIDYFFWRRRRICTDAEKNLRLELNELNATNASLQTNIGGLQSRLDAGKAELADLRLQLGRLGELESELALRNGELEGLHARVAGLDDIETKLGTKGWTLGGFMAGLFGSHLWDRWSGGDGEVDFDAHLDRMAALEGEVEAKNSELGRLQLELGRIGELESSLAARDAEISRLRADLGDYQALESKVEAKGWTLAGFMAGITGSSLWHRWSNRGETDVDFDADLGRVAELEARIGDLEGQLSGKDDELANLLALQGEQASLTESKLADCEAAVADLKAQLSGKDDELANLLALQADQSRTSVIPVIESMEVAEAAVDPDINLNLAGAGAAVGTLAAAGLVAGGAVAPERDDDYTTLWGIGPKINGLLKAAGFRSFAQLADADPTAIHAVLEDAGPRFRLTSQDLQDSWRIQAQLAHEEKWDELNQLKAELAAARQNNDSLRHIWGIGSKAENMLNQLGIGSLTDLRGADRGRLTGFLSYIKGFYGDRSEDDVYDAIQTQAQLATEGRWISLKRLQAPFRANRGADDLTEVWGIGRKAQNILRGLGISSFADLADAPRDALSDAMTYIKSWYGADASEETVYQALSDQARLAAVGDWDGLNTAKEPYRSLRRTDDLKLLWGIGPKVEQVLNQGGIRSFRQLAEAPVERIRSILEGSDTKLRAAVHDLQEAWKTQAALAADGRWDDLDELQSGMNWGDFDDNPDN